jgi:hypothetical protein
MKSSLLAIVVLCLASQQVKAVDEQGTIVYEKKRAPKIFNVKTRVAGHYVESMKAITDTQMTFGDQEMDSAITIVTESDVVVTDDATTGGSHITAAVTHMEMISETAGFKIECNTDEDSEVTNAACIDLYKVLGDNITFDLDKDGNIISASGPGSDFVKKAYVKKGSSPLETTPSATDSSNGDEFKDKWTKTSRMLQLVPTDAEVKPGDTWDSSTDLGEIGHFTGTGTMLGYRTVDDRDCAVFSFTGTLQMNMDKLVDAVGDSSSLMASVLEDVKMSDAKMDSLMYYDDELGIMRWSKTHQTSVMTMPDMTGEKDTISIPTDTTTITSCRVKQ